MTLREDLNALTPRLRRYARALVSGHPGGSDRADDLVHATLLRALGSRNLGANADLVVRLYATLSQLHREIADTREQSRNGTVPHAAYSGGRASTQQAATGVRQSKLTTGLMSLSLDEREALLLVALENFDHDEAARILRISRSTLLSRLTQARLALDARLSAQTGSASPTEHRPASHLRLVK